MDLLRSRSCSAKVFIMIGTGLKRIVDACKESSYRCEFEVQKSGFVVIFHRPENESRSDDPINDPINDPKTYLVSDPISQYGIQENEKLLLDALRTNPSSTYSDLAESLGVSQATIKRMLQKLVAKKRIERIGSNKKGSWKLLD